MFRTTHLHPAVHWEVRYNGSTFHSCIRRVPPRRAPQPRHDWAAVPRFVFSIRADRNTCGPITIIGGIMVSLFGMQLSKSELLTRVGNLSQIAGIRMGELADGPGRGIRTADFRTGSGFAFTSLLDRGLDVLWASYGNAPLVWCSETGPVAPSFYEPEEQGWLRGFGGGLFTTCGLTSFGPQGVDAGQTVTMHGRASFLPASQIARGEGWQGDRYEMWLQGELRQATVFGENLVLRRRISARLGESKLYVADTVTNEGFATTPLMLLYHCNFGFPIVSENSELLVHSEVTGRDEDAKASLAEHRHFQPPTPNYRPCVYFHRPVADSQGLAGAALVNRSLHGGAGLGVYIRFPIAAMPCLNQWKMMGQGHYVCGLEPGTNWVLGRAAAREAGTLQQIEPGESRNFSLEVGVLESTAAIEEFAASLR